MKKFNPVFYLLFILLIMGAFASMAQNSYGLKIMGGVAFLFGFVFLVEFFTAVSKKGPREFYLLLELICLAILAIIFGLRLFYIHFPYVEYVFTAASLVLALLYVRKMIIRYRELKPRNGILAFLALIFHLSIVFFLFSMVVVSFQPRFSVGLAAAALVLLLIFLVGALFNRNLLADGVNYSAFRLVKHFKDHSIVLVSLFLLFTLYVGMNRIGLLPAIYSDEYPKAYFELVDEATSRKEKPVNGRYKHEDFKEKYEQFLKNASQRK